MSAIKIQATEYSIYKVFSNDFVFTIPLYQRPYAWTTEQAGELLEDLLASLGNGNEPIDNVNPYFLGSIVLIKGDKSDAQVVDGQQRLSTLTILLAVLRTLVEKRYADALTKLLYEESDPFLGVPNRYRLTLAKRDEEFFQKYIQDEGGINKLKDLNSAALSDSQKNIKNNSILFLERLKILSDAQRLRLGQFIINRCLLVVVSTPDFDSAYRIFSVLNERGLDLSITDILKADIIGKISNQQKEKYTGIWEKIELELGREAFEELFSHIRMIYRKAKLGNTVLSEIRKYVEPINQPQHFIDKRLYPFAEAFHDIKNTNYLSENRAAVVNNLFGWLNKIDNADWLPPAILYLSKNSNDSHSIEHFFTDLERLAAGLMIQRTNINDRIKRYSRLLTAIEREENLYSSDSPLQLTGEEKRDILNTLDGDLYLIPKIRLYVMLRLDNAFLDNGLSNPKVLYDFSSITIEHILPQNPTNRSEWETLFPSQQQREKYLHRIGNLVLLSRKKNSEAQNFDFKKKKAKYFTTKTGVSPFALTTQVLNEQEWTPEVIQQWQQKRIDKLKKVWRL